MNKTLLLSRPLLFGAAVLAAGLARADDYHYLNMLIGDRASGLGGAYTAISDDATGLFYNPAGIAYTRGRNLSASVNAYHVTSSSYKNVLGGGSWDRESSSLLPNFFGVIQPLGRGVAGFSYAVTDSVQENLDQQFFNRPAFIDRFIINLNNSDSTYKLGPSYAMELSDGFSVGMTAYAHIRNVRTNMQQVLTGIHAVDAGGNPIGPFYEWTTSYYQRSEAGFEPVLGLMWTPGDRLTIGAAVRKPMVLNSSTKFQSTCASDFPGSCGSTAPLSPPIAHSSAKSEYPLQVNLGAAYFPNENLLYSAEFVYYGRTSDQVRGDRPSTWNASAGVEYYVSSAWALRGGIFTNNANTPTLKANAVDQLEHVDLLGFSASVSRFTRNSSITGGIAFASGDGKAQIVSAGPVQNESMFTATAFLSTSYNY